MRCFPKFYSWDCFIRLHYEVIIFSLTYIFCEYSGQISPLRNFTGSKFVLVTSQLCLLWFGVNFCMSHDFSSCLTSQLCLLRFGVNFCMSYDFSSCFFLRMINRREFLYSTADLVCVE